MKKERRPLNSIACDYFGYTERHIPQQCASDEFYFPPRTEAAIQHLNVLDDLTLERIRDHIRYVQNLLGEIPEEDCEDLEEEIDRLLLRQSIESFIKEFHETGISQGSFKRFPYPMSAKTGRGLEIKQREYHLLGINSCPEAFSWLRPDAGRLQWAENQAMKN